MEQQGFQSEQPPNAKPEEGTGTDREVIERKNVVLHAMETYGRLTHWPDAIPNDPNTLKEAETIIERAQATVGTQKEYFRTINGILKEASENPDTYADHPEILKRVMWSGLVAANERARQTVLDYDERKITKEHLSSQRQAAYDDARSVLDRFRKFLDRDTIQTILDSFHRSVPPENDYLIHLRVFS